ncbi:TPA: hypothetical protein OUL42_002833 [Clostridioides difficile]|nr:hypothetical protein [Clostridioides difficile]HBH4040941.1 hypothetical protein [Clostridioides difficile]HCU2582853.1 hypothetical protein [Clostridioides difficile]HCU2766846.1 hypothetical protein [Clostridioides difficile]
MINYEYEVDLEESCKQKLEDFINKIVTNYCDDLMLHGWLGIKVVKELPHNSSGRMEAGYILLPLATLNDILQENTLKVQIAESTIFHEFCHFDLLNLLPLLHQEKENAENKDDYALAMSILIWIEFLAQGKSTFLEPYQNIKDYFVSVNNYRWNFSSYKSLLIGLKHAPYIITRDMDIRSQKEKFIQNLKSSQLKNMILDIKEILLEMKSTSLEDSLTSIKPLEKYILQKYKQYPEL